MATDQVNIPSLVAVLVLSGLVVRYLFFSPSTPALGSGSNTSSSNTGGSSRDTSAQTRAREANVERIQQMFPQVERRTILWDLQRNGNSLATTTEKILSGTLGQPPASFQPPPPPPSAVPATHTSSRTSATRGTGASKPAQPDLIQRYNLQDKVAQPGVSEETASAGGKSWSTSKDERQASLQKRRDDMILAARRKMEAKIAAEKAGTPGS